MVEKISRRVDFILVACMVLLLPCGLFAQTEAEDYMVLNRLTRENGLPDQDINGIYFDDQGYAWIGTFGGGLVRYDGDSVLPFSSKAGASTIGDIVRQCREDHYGRLWIPGASLEVEATTRAASGSPAATSFSASASRTTAAASWWIPCNATSRMTT